MFYAMVHSKSKVSGFLMSGLIVLFSCQPTSTPAQEEFDPSSEWKAYWYAGVAELSTYELKQARYGEIREGLATAIFVTEDFSQSRLVKLDDPEGAGNDKVSVLKFNLNKKFITGVYDYALMQSTFKPVDFYQYPNALRVTTSNIEWCGQFLTSARLKKDRYHLQYQSYFDGEENKTFTLKSAILEDEIWNWIRLSPTTLPQGKQRMIPGILTQELTHQELRIEEADCRLVIGDSLHIYQIDYPAIQRKLIIRFHSQFPYLIESWEESFQTVEGWGMESKNMTTLATRKATIQTDYWEKKYLKDEVLRKELGITDAKKD